MEITELQLRNLFQRETGLIYYNTPQKYMFWRRAYRKKHAPLNIYMNDPESHARGKGLIYLNPKQTEYIINTL